MWDQHASIATLRDYAAVAVLALIMPMLRWTLHTCAFKHLATFWVVPQPQRNLKALPEKLAAKVDKISESLWKILMYSTFFGIGVKASYSQSWAWHSQELWEAWPYQQFSPTIRVLYCLEMAFCISGVAMLLLWETRRHDHTVMLLHHIVTAVLITASYYYNYLRVGCLVLMLHDINDILLETAKTAKYCKYEAGSTVFFVTFVISWAATRLTYFPGVIIRSTLMESHRVLGYQPPGYWVFNALLCTLLVIHWYWFRLILNVIWVKVRTGAVQDVREEDDD